MSEKRVSMSEISELRERTGAGVVDCKKALQESGGSLEEAVQILRKKGIASAAKKSGKIAAEGATIAAISPDSKYGIIFELNSQTDFVAKNDKFQNFIKKIVEVCLAKKPENFEELKNLKALDSEETVLEQVVSLSGEIGEKIDLRRFSVLQAKKPEEKVAFYTHPIGFTVSVLVLYTGEKEESGKNIAMHIAAANPAPEFITVEEIPREKREKEAQIERGKEDLAGKPEKVIENIVRGRLDKRLAEFTLAKQPYVKQSDLTVEAYCKESGTSVLEFIRINLGEGIEKKELSFSEEVAAQTQKL